MNLSMLLFPNKFQTGSAHLFYDVVNFSFSPVSPPPSLTGHSRRVLKISILVLIALVHRVLPRDAVIGMGRVGQSGRQLGMPTAAAARHRRHLQRVNGHERSLALAVLVHELPPQHQVTRHNVTLSTTH